MNEKRDLAAEPRRIVVCYNSACPDYRRERPWGEPCACKRKHVREPRHFHDFQDFSSTGP